MRKYLYLLFVLTAQLAWAQKITIKGQLKDTTNAPLPSATVLLLSPKDSALINFGLTNAEGVFEIKNVVRQEYLFSVMFMGYATLTKKITPSPDQPVLDVGTLQLQPEVKQLGEVTVEAMRAPVTIKKDTIEFNAGSFKTKENALVEDLLKKLPGVEVDNDGTIRAQGEQVKSVTIDGKKFFGNDPKLATRNLPADAIDKVQVYNKKSDQAVFSGIDDGEREKTINLELKEEKRNGAFGTLQGGYGTDDRYQLRGNLNRFKKGQQLSLLGMANNINEQGFGIDDYLSFTGQGMSGGGGRVNIRSDNQNGIPLNLSGRTSGLMTNYAGGANFNNEFSKKTELNASYFYNQLDHDLTETTERINYRPTGDLRFNQASRQHNTNYNHRISTTLEHKIDSMNSIKWTTGITYNETDASEISTSENLSAMDSLENESQRNTSSSGTSLNVNSSLLWRHRFAKKGRTFSANFQGSVSDSDRDGAQDATTQYYVGEQETVNLLQTNTQATDNVSYSGTFSYTEPLGGRKYLEANYSFRQNLNKVDRSVYDINNGEPVFNASLSNQYTSDYRYHRAGLNFKLNRSKYNLTVGSSLQQTALEGELKLLNSTISKSYQNVLPVARFNYDFAMTKHLEASYETSVQEPTIQQLQPVVDNSDPLNLSVGNPDLRPAYKQNWRLNFMSFNPITFINFFSFLETTYTRNAITTAQNYTEQQERISMPVNVDHNLRINGNATFGFHLQKVGSRFNISANATQERGVNVIDETENNIVQNVVGGRLRYDFRYKEIFDFSLGANISRQSTDYEFDEQADQLYFNKTYTAETNLTFLKNYQFNTSLEYLVYESKTTDYKQSIPFWNMSFSRFLLKARSGELKFSVNNILDQRVGVSQTADINYFERQTSNSLGRYFMVSFIYALNKQLNPMGMRPRGGMFRISR
jgi:hypothetical protein